MSNARLDFVRISREALYLSLSCSQPGLGKTIQAIGIAYSFRKEWPLLVISPSSARYHWQAELVRWLKGEGGAEDLITEDEVQVVIGGNQPLRPTAKAVIVSYDLVDRVQDMLNTTNAGSGFKVIVADECHMLRNQKTKRAKATLPMLRAAQRAILLSGTPALSRPKVGPKIVLLYHRLNRESCTGALVPAQCHRQRPVAGLPGFCKALLLW